MQYVWLSGRLDLLCFTPLHRWVPPKADHTQHPPPLLRSLLLSPENKTERRQTSRDGWRDWPRMELGGGAQFQAYVCSDTFSLFLFSRPVLIISILGCWGPPNIEPVLIDQAFINKPRQGWQHVSRGRGQICCTDYLYYQGWGPLRASGVCVQYVWYLITTQEENSPHFIWTRAELVGTICCSTRWELFFLMLRLEMMNVINCHWRSLKVHKYKQGFIHMFTNEFILLSHALESYFHDHSSSETLRTDGK